MAIAGSSIASAPIAGSAEAITLDADVIEAMALADTVAADGVGEASVFEDITLADAASATAVFSPAVSETLTLADVLSATGVFGGSVSEAMTLSESTTAIRFVRTWFLSFANVTPPPDMQGPGNPGKLKGDYRYEEEE